MVTTEH